MWQLERDESGKMTVICSWCRMEAKEFEFRSIGNDIQPVCKVCIVGQKLKEEEMIQTLHELETSFVDGEQNTLLRWTK